MADMVTRKQLEDASQDAATLGAFVNGAEGEPNVNRAGEDVQNLATIQAEIGQQAAIAAGVYATPASGVDPQTGVAVGKHFWVASSLNGVLLELWRNSAGTAVDTGKRMDAGGQVGRDRLASQFLFVASLSSAESLSDQLREGGYLLVPGVVSVPERFSGASVARISAAGLASGATFRLIDEVWPLSDLRRRATRLRMPNASPPTVGAWLYDEDSVLPDSTVTRAKLGSQYSYGGILTGTDTINRQLGTNDFLVTSKPEGAPPEGATSAYLSSVGLNSSSFEIHVWRDLTAPENVYVRFARPLQATPVFGEWKTTGATVANASVSRAKLASTFNFVGVLSSGDVKDVVDEGDYLIAGATGAPGNGYLKVRNYSSRSFVVQEWQALLSPADRRTRYLRPLQPAPVVGPWEGASGGSSPYAGKTAVFFGDSITEFGDYPNRVALRLGLTAIKQGYGGTRMGRHNTTAQGLLYDKMCMYNLARYINTGDFSELIAAAQALYELAGDDNRPQAAALAAIDFNAVDYVIIADGTNDFGGDLPLGDDADATGDTFKGAINYTVQQLLSAYPHLQIVFVAPLWRARFLSGDGRDADLYPNNAGVFLREYVQAVIDRAAAHKLPSLDLYHGSGINALNAANFLADGLHPVAGIGFQRIADRVSAFLSGRI